MNKVSDQVQLEEAVKSSESELENSANEGEEEFSGGDNDSNSEAVTQHSTDNSYPYSIDSMCFSQADLTQGSSQPSLPSLGQEDRLSLLPTGESIKRVPSLSLYFKPTSNSSQGEVSEEQVDCDTDDQSKVVFTLGSEEDDVNSPVTSNSGVCLGLFSQT